MVFPKVRNTSSNNSCNRITTIFITCSTVRLMSLPAILVGIIVLIIVAPLYAQPLTPGGNSRNFEYKRYCSNSLTDAMRLICGGHSIKNSSAGENLLRIEQIHECCRRPCGYSELKMYCAPV